MEDDGVDQQARKEEADDGGEGNGGEAAATGEPEEMCFSARLDNAKSVTTLLSCLSNGTKKDQHARCEVSMDGLTFVVTSRAMSTQASGELRAAMFQAYDCEPGVHHFGINLITLLECLQVFGPSMLAQTSLSMSYHPLEGIFRLTLEEAGVFTSCEIRTLHEDDEGADYAMLAQAYRQHDEEGAIVMRSEYLKEPFQELADFPGASRVTFAVSQKAPFFQLSVAGSMGTSKVDFPKNSEAFVIFECSVPRLSWTYLLSAFENGMRALSSSKETLFRINAAGILCIQHQLPVSQGTNAFIDFLLCPDVAIESGGEGAATP